MLTADLRVAFVESGDMPRQIVDALKDEAANGARERTCKGETMREMKIISDWLTRTIIIRIGYLSSRPARTGLT